MTAYFTRRLLLMIPTFLGVTFIVFWITRIVPGGPVERQIMAWKQASGQGEAGAAGGGGISDPTANIPEAALDQLRKQYGFDKPWYVAYAHWLGNVLTLDLGDSFFFKKPVWTMISQRFPVSLTFGLTGFLLAYLISVPLGIAKAVRHGTAFDFTSSAMVFIGYSIPGWALGGLLLLVLASGQYAEWFPFGNARSTSYSELPEFVRQSVDEDDVSTDFGVFRWERLPYFAKLADYAWHMALPVVCYMMGSFATLTILTKNSLMDNLGQDYVRTAFAKGLAPRRVIFLHTLRNSLIPLATGLGHALGVLMAGSYLIEFVFNIDGIGYLGFTAITGRDYAIVMGVLVVNTLLILFGNVFSDVLYALVDPADSLRVNDVPEDTPNDANAAPPAQLHLSPLQLRLKRFRRMRRGYFSFLILAGAYLLTFFLPFLVNDRAIVVRYEGSWYFPAFANYVHDTFGLGRESIVQAEVFDQRDDDGAIRLGETDYRLLAERFSGEDGTGNFAVLPLLPYDPNESFLEVEGNPPHQPSWAHPLGTDDRARDMLTRLAYGFRISITFALLVTGSAYLLGVLVGATLGYFGGWPDIIGQRFVEIWGAIPFLYTVIILAAVLGKSFLLLMGILAAFGWMSITYYVRGEFYREKAKDYVAAAIATGESNLAIMIQHVLPNSLTPIITFAPFAIVANVVSLVSLDFLGFGLPEPTPSWGELLRQAKTSGFSDWHMVVFPLGALFLTLQLIVFIGEAVREAFDPKVFSRLR